MIVSDAVIWLSLLLLSIMFTDMAWSDHNQYEYGKEVGYATILIWVRTIAFFFIAMAFWALMAEVSTTLNNCDFTFGACFTNPSESTSTGTISVSVFAHFLPYIFLGLALLHMVVGIVITLYLVLPTERLPKSFQYFSKQKPEGYNDDVK